MLRYPCTILYFIPYSSYVKAESLWLLRRSQSIVQVFNVLFQIWHTPHENNLADTMKVKDCQLQLDALLMDKPNLSKEHYVNDMI